MEEQKNHPESAKSISTTMGVVVLVLIAIIIGLVVWKSKGDTDSALNAPTVNTPVQVKKTVETADETPTDNSSAATAGNQTGSAATQTPIDFDKELKNMDNSVNSVNFADFGDTGLSNANLGL